MRVTKGTNSPETLSDDTISKILGKSLALANAILESILNETVRKCLIRDKFRWAKLIALL